MIYRVFRNGQNRQICSGNRNLKYNRNKMPYKFKMKEEVINENIFKLPNSIC